MQNGLPIIMRKKNLLEKVKITKAELLIQKHRFSKKTK